MGIGEVGWKRTLGIQMVGLYPNIPAHSAHEHNHPERGLTDARPPRCLAATSPSPPWFPGPQHTSTRGYFSFPYTVASVCAHARPANSISYGEHDEGRPVVSLLLLAQVRAVYPAHLVDAERTRGVHELLIDLCRAVMPR